MSKYRKGRVVVLASMVGFASITVLAGTSPAAEQYHGGKLQLVSSDGSTNFSRVKGKMRNVVGSACVTIRTSNFHLDKKNTKAEPLTATFKGMGPLDHKKADTFTAQDDANSSAITPSGDNTFDLSAWLPTLLKKNKKVEKRGYHVQVKIGDRKLNFWVAADGINTGCGTPAEGVSCGTDHFNTTTWNPSATSVPAQTVDGFPSFPVSINTDNPADVAVDDDGTPAVTISYQGSTGDPVDLDTTLADNGTVSAVMPALAVGDYTITAYEEYEVKDAATGEVTETKCSEVSKPFSIGGTGSNG